MKNSIEKTDEELKNDVLSALNHDLNVTVTDINVLVEEGTVILSGKATHYVEKSAAVRAVQGLEGVQAVEDNIQVELLDSLSRADPDIALVVTDQAESSTTIPRNH